MDEFSYLSVLLSIIIGLAVAEILQGFRGRMLHSARVLSYWPARLWSVTLLLICAQSWWAMFGLRSRHTWTFDEFLVVLAHSIVLYLICGLAFPDFSDRAEIVDLRAHYFAQRKRFFALIIVVTLLSIARDLVLHHSLPSQTNLAFHIVYLVTAVIAVLTANEWYHKALALVMAVVFVNYITTLFVRLQ